MPYDGKENYTALSTFLSEFPNELVLRRFRGLNIRNVLFYQAELLHLEHELQQIEELDKSKNATASDRATFRWTAAALRKRKTDLADGASSNADLYQEKVLEIRDTLNKYHQALRDFNFQEQLSSPSQSTLDDLKYWLKDPAFGRAFLLGSIEDAWNSSLRTEEFLVFQKQHGFIMRASQLILSLRRAFSANQNPAKIWSIDASSEGSVALGISTIVSSIFPVLPIIVLFFVHSLIARIGIIMAFTAVFATILVFGLKIPPDQVLTITTAIAAIQVVYVGSTANGIN